MSGTAHRHRRPAVIAAAIAAVVLVGAAVTLAWAYFRLEGNISTIDSTDGLGDLRPAKQNEAVNILAIGSDSRAGGNAVVGGESPGLADTTMVVHLSADNAWAAAVSIPRDSMVQMPACFTPDGSIREGGLRQFNSAYQIGGPVCVQRTIESLTGLHIDHFVVIDFVGFRDMVEAVGGVTVYIDKPISDPNSNIFFDAGCQTLSGKLALDYVRVRHGAGDGSDPSRIKRQQVFLSSLVQKVTSSGVLFNPVELYRFLDAVTKAVTTDTGLGGIRNMGSLAVRVREIGLDRIEFTTIPWEGFPPDPNRVQWAQPEADELWDLLRRDIPLTPAKASPSPSPSGSGSSGSPSASPTRSASPSPTGPTSPAPTFDTRSADSPVCPS